MLSNWGERIREIGVFGYWNLAVNLWNLLGGGSKNKILVLWWQYLRHKPENEGLSEQFKEIRKGLMSKHKRKGLP